MPSKVVGAGLLKTVEDHCSSVSRRYLCLSGPYGFGLALNLFPFSSFLCLPFRMEMSIICLSHHCILEAHNLFDFIGSQLDRNFPQNDFYLESHPYLI